MLSKIFGMFRMCSAFGFIGQAVSSMVISFFMTGRLKRVRWLALAPSMSLMITSPFTTICSSLFPTPVVMIICIAHINSLKLHFEGLIDLIWQSRTIRPFLSNPGRGR